MEFFLSYCVFWTKPNQNKKETGYKIEKLSFVAILYEVLIREITEGEEHAG